MDSGERGGLRTRTQAGLMTLGKSLNYSELLGNFPHMGFPMKSQSESLSLFLCTRGTDL